MPSRCPVTALLAGILALGAGTTAAAPPRRSGGRGKILDQGVFTLSLAGQEVGTEKFEIRASGGKIEARAEIQLHLEQNGKTLDVRDTPDLLLDSQLNPLSYSWTQKGSPSYHLTIDFRSSPAKILGKPEHGEEDRREIQLPKDVIVLDDNVIHHFQLLVDRYHKSRGGKQTFRAFIPQEALPGEFQVEDVGEEPVTIRGTALKLRHLVVTSDLARIDLWIGDHQRLQRVAMPDKQFEALRGK